MRFAQHFGATIEGDDIDVTALKVWACGLHQFFSGNDLGIGRRVFVNTVLGGRIGQIRGNRNIVAGGADLLLLGNGFAQTVGGGVAAAAGIFFYFGKGEAFGIGSAGKNR